MWKKGSTRCLHCLQMHKVAHFERKCFSIKTYLITFDYIQSVVALFGITQKEANILLLLRDILLQIFFYLLNKSRAQLYGI